MIKVNKVSKDYCYGEIRGAWDDLMDEYKAITDYFFTTSFC